MDRKQYLKDYYSTNKERLKKQKHEWYLANRERIIARDAEYKRINKDLINQKRKSYPSYKNHARIRKYEPIKLRARWMIQTHLRRGKIKRLPCQICGELKAQAHHEDYNKPLDVIWLCAKHHADLHKGVLKLNEKGIEPSYS